MKLKAPALIFVASCCFFSFPASAMPGDENWDITFGVPGANGAIGSFLVVEGVLYTGGSFTEIGGVSASGIAKWDGTNWSSLSSGVNGSVSAVLSWKDKLYVAGNFDHAGVILTKNIACWDGTNWSALGSGLAEGVGNEVHALASDGAKLYAGGRFHRAGGLNATNVAAWDGTSWAALGDGVSAICGDEEPREECGVVNCLAVFERTLFVGGSFRGAGGLDVNNIAMWDGTNWSSPGAGLRTYDTPNLPNSFNGSVNAFASSMRSLYALGDFRRAGSVFSTNLARWTGTEWESLNAGTRSPFGGPGAALTLVLNGKNLYLGGAFAAVAGVLANNITQGDGTNWFALGSGVTPAPDGLVSALCSTGTELFVGGIFNSAGGSPSTNIALWHIPHSLSINRSGNAVELSWPATGSNMVLQAKNDLDGADWISVPQPLTIVNDRCVVTNEISSSRRFYRLRRW